MEMAGALDFGAARAQDGGVIGTAVRRTPPRSARRSHGDAAPWLFFCPSSCTGKETGIGWRRRPSVRRAHTTKRLGRSDRGSPLSQYKNFRASAWRFPTPQKRHDGAHRPAVSGSAGFDVGADCGFKGGCHHETSEKTGTRKGRVVVHRRMYRVFRMVRRNGARSGGDFGRCCRCRLFPLRGAGRVLLCRRHHRRHSWRQWQVARQDGQLQRVDFRAARAQDGGVIGAECCDHDHTAPDSPQVAQRLRACSCPPFADS